MSLFNEYQNKNFTYLTRYINWILLENDGKTEEDMKEILIGENQLTYDDITEELSNSKKDVNENALLFTKQKDDSLLPICPIPVPVRATKAERAWLYYYIQKPEAKLFLDDNTLGFLKTALEADKYHEAYPLNDKTYDVREFPIKETLHRTMEFKNNFSLILKAIKEKKYIYTDNHTFKGEVFANSKLIPFRFEYIKQNGAMHVSAFTVCDEDDKCRSIKLNLNNLHRTKIGEKVENYDFIYQKYLASRNRGYDIKQPLTIKITDHFNGFDRAVYTFANYMRESYRDVEGNIIMKIYYRSFQENELINKLLFLGSALTVIGPDSIKRKYISILKDTLKNY